jgi:hypothetical protein
MARKVDFSLIWPDFSILPSMGPLSIHLLPNGL